MKPTGSSLARAAACPASHALPQATSSRYAADRGNVIHKFLARVAKSPADRSAALAEVPKEFRDVCSKIDVVTALDGLSGVRTEVAYAFDPACSGVRFLGENIDREYGALAATELACSLDVDAMSVRPVVLDWKTGQDVGPVRENWQIRLQALCKAAACGWPEEVEGRIAYIDDDGTTNVLSHIFVADELDESEQQIRRTLRRVEDAEKLIASGGIPNVAEGEHCRYCPAMHMCPAKTALARAALAELADIDTAIASLTTVQAGAAWDKWRRIKALGEKLEDALKARAEEEPLPLPNGKVLKMVPTSGRKYLHTESGLALLRAKGATDEEVATVLKTSRAGVTAKEVNP